MSTRREKTQTHIHLREEEEEEEEDKLQVLLNIKHSLSCVSRDDSVKYLNV